MIWRSHFVYTSCSLFTFDALLSSLVDILPMFTNILNPASQHLKVMKTNTMQNQFVYFTLFTFRLFTLLITRNFYYFSNNSNP